MNEGGFISEWNNLAFNAQINQNKDTFLEPVIKKTPDSIQFEKLWSMVLLCLALSGLSGVLFGLEIIVQVCKMSKFERWFLRKRIKQRLQLIIQSFRRGK